MDSFENVRARLNEVLAEVYNGNVAAMARAMNIEEDSGDYRALWRAVNGETKNFKSWIPNKVIEHIHVNEEWLMWGKGSMFLGDIPKYPSSRTYEILPVMSANGRVVRKQVMDRHTLSVLAQSSPNKIRIFEMKTNAWAPTCPVGAPLAYEAYDEPTDNIALSGTYMVTFKGNQTDKDGNPEEIFPAIVSVLLSGKRYHIEVPNHAYSNVTVKKEGEKWQTHPGDEIVFRIVGRILFWPQNALVGVESRPIPQF